MLSSGKDQWYLYLNYLLQNGDNIQFVEQKTKLFKVNQEWNIIHNGEVIGNVRTDYSFKNAVKLKEGLILNLRNETYYFKSFGIGSDTKAYKDDEMIASGKRSELFRYQYEFEVKEGYEEIEPILVMTYILFNYVHNQ